MFGLKRNALLSNFCTLKRLLGEERIHELVQSYIGLLVEINKLPVEVPGGSELLMNE